MPYLDINELELKKYNISINDYRSWERHPMTHLIREILEREYYTKSALFTSCVKFSDTEQMSLTLAEMKGALGIIEMFIKKTDNELELKDLLDEYITWQEEIEDEDKDDTSNRMVY